MLYDSSAILIPAYNPNEMLLSLLASLTQHFRYIIVVDDGSNEDRKDIFGRAAQFDAVTILHHHINLGKGAALRTGLNYIAVKFQTIMGVITVDADGQHLPEDIIRVAAFMEKHPHALILGCRVFDHNTAKKNNIPWRSYVGNSLTRIIFQHITGLHISDTQTGLRGIPYSFIGHLLRLRTNGYDFELDMLLLARNMRIQIKEIQISTIYLDENKSSHFNPLLDSLKIYLVFLRFGITSLITAAIDFICFFLLINCGASIFLSICLARIVAGGFNFSVNRCLVFRYGGSIFAALRRYICCVAFIGVLSYAFVQVLLGLGIQSIMLAKIFSETVLFILSFLIQKDFVFGNWKMGDKND